MAAKKEFVANTDIRMRGQVIAAKGDAVKLDDDTLERLEKEGHVSRKVADEKPETDAKKTPGK